MRTEILALLPQEKLEDQGGGLEEEFLHFLELLGGGEDERHIAGKN